MDVKLHANARTTPRTRALIPASDLPVAVLAKQFGVSEVTIRRWRKREHVQDRSHRPHHLTISLSPLEEQLACELRQLVRLSVDDITDVLQRCLHANISRSAVYRSLRRHGLNRLPAAAPAPPMPFEPTAAGYVHIDLKHLPRLEGKPGYVFVAIERTTRFAHIEIVEQRDAHTIAACLERFLAAFAYPVHTILTNNGSEFTDRFGGSYWYKGGRGVSGQHAFDRVCAAHGITHKLTRPFTPRTNGMVERFNRRIAKAIAEHPKAHANAGKNTFESRLQRDRYLMDFVHAYNRTRLKCINYQTPLLRRNNLTEEYTFAMSWRRHWEQVIPFFAFSAPIRRIIYTTNAIEALNSKLRRAVCTRGHFPGGDAAMKLLYLVLNQAAAEWKRPPREWVEAKTQFAVIFGERFVI